MNLIHGMLAHNGNGTRFRSELISADLSNHSFLSAPLSGERAVVAGLRPEQITLGPGTGLPELAATISVIEAMGPDTIL